MLQEFHCYVKKYGIEPNRYSEEQKYFIEALLSFKKVFDPDDERIGRLIAFVATHSKPQLSISDISRLSGYSRTQVRNIKKETSDQFFSATNRCNHGGRKPIIQGELLKKLIKLVIEDKETNISKIARELSQEDKSISRKAVEGALARIGMLESVLNARKEAQRKIFVTRFSGVWLLLPYLLTYYPAIEKTFGHIKNGMRSILTLFVMAFVGIARVFHLPDIQDTGLALFTGGSTILCRQIVGSFIKNVGAHLVRQFQKMTEPVKRFALKSLRISFDDHVIPRWTRLFAIPKAYCTNRGRGLKAERIYSFFEVVANKVLRVIATSGKMDMKKVVFKAVRLFIQAFKPSKSTFYFDGSSSQKNQVIKQLLGLKHRVIIRAPRRPCFMKRWRKELRDNFKTYYENTEIKRIKRPIRVAETRTLIDGMSVRTIIAVEDRSSKNGKKKECWHVLFTNDEKGEPYEIVKEYRDRQHHEQFYRVSVRDMNLDALPNGYRWWSPNRQKPGFEPKRLNFVGWIKALAFNAITDWAKQLPKPYAKMFPSTLIRKFVFRTGVVELTKQEVIVRILPFNESLVLSKYIARVNEKEYRIPWLAHRRLRIEMLESGSQFCQKAPLFTVRC